MRLSELYVEFAMGTPVKRKAWKGYWRYWFGDVKMHTREGEVVDLKDMENPLFTLAGVLADDWEIATPENCPVLAAELQAKKAAVTSVRGVHDPLVHAYHGVGFVVSGPVECGVIKDGCEGDCESCLEEVKSASVQEFKKAKAWFAAETEADA